MFWQCFDTVFLVPGPSRTLRRWWVPYWTSLVLCSKCWFATLYFKFCSNFPRKSLQQTEERQRSEIACCRSFLHSVSHFLSDDEPQTDTMGFSTMPVFSCRSKAELEAETFCSCVSERSTGPSSPFSPQAHPPHVSKRSTRPGEARPCEGDACHQKWQRPHQKFDGEQKVIRTNTIALNWSYSRSLNVCNSSWSRGYPQGCQNYPEFVGIIHDKSAHFRN